MNRDILDSLAKIEDLKTTLNQNVNEYNKAYSKLSKEDKKQISDKHFEVNKLFEMIKTGNIDEKYVTEIQSKYAN